MPTEPELWVVDRMEGTVAVLVSDDGQIVDVGRASLPKGAKAGVVVRVPRDARGGLEWSRAFVDEQATRERRSAAEDVLRELRKRDPGGDIAL